MMKSILTAVWAFIVLSIAGCASDSGSYQYQVSAYQLGNKPVPVWYRPNINDYYTQYSKGYAESGIVELALGINQDGAVKKVEVITSSGYERLDSSATALAYGMVFNPYAEDGKTQEGLKLFVNFHKESNKPPVKVTNVTYRVELLTGFQFKASVGAVANPAGFMESVFPLEPSGQALIDSEALGYGSRYMLEPFPVNQSSEKQDIKLQITFN
jgi:TonB family protein